MKKYRMLCQPVALIALTALIISAESLISSDKGVVIALVLFAVFITLVVIGGEGRKA